MTNAHLRERVTKLLNAMIDSLKNNYGIVDCSAKLVSEPFKYEFLVKGRSTIRGTITLRNTVSLNTYEYEQLCEVYGFLSEPF